MAYAKRYAGGFVDKPTLTTPIDSTFLNAVEAALLKLLDADPSAAGQVPIWTPGGNHYVPGLITNASIDPAAAIAKSKLAALNISDADVAGGAAIARSKLNFGAGLVDADIAAAAAIAASKISGGVGMQLICDSVLGASAALFDTNTILGGNIPQTFKHLKVVFNGRSDAAALARVGTTMRFNNDSAVNYAYGVVMGDTSTPSAAFATASGGPITDTLAATAPASQATSSETTVFDYTNTTFFKNASGHGFARYGAANDIEQVIGFSWSQAVAITRIQVIPNSGNFIAGSRFTLYGIA